MTVVHCKKKPYDVYIGRPSKWGNPYSHLTSRTAAEFQVQTRAEAIERYKEWLQHHYSIGTFSLQDLADLHGKVLGCWCKPKACHGDYLVKVAEWAHHKLYGESA